MPLLKLDNKPEQKTSYELPKHKEGRIYILRVKLKDGEIIHKVGMTNTTNRSVDRMMEILRSFFNTYRYIPQTQLIRDRKFKIPFIVEKYIHNILLDYRHKFDKKFSGSTEFFDINEDVFLEWFDNFTYIEMLRGQTVMDSEKYTLISQVIQEEQGESDDLPKWAK